MSAVDGTAGSAAARPERYNASCIVDRQVDAGRGGKAAFVAADAILTYDALPAQVNRAGHVLRSLGVGREQRVLLVLDDTTAFPILFLGAMRIGAVPVPVSPLDATRTSVTTSRTPTRRSCARMPRRSRACAASSRASS